MTRLLLLLLLSRRGSIAAAPRVHARDPRARRWHFQTGMVPLGALVGAAVVMKSKRPRRGRLTPLDQKKPRACVH